ncbi:MFS transporter [Pseudorhodoferax sp. Leaf265]|uniref:MFS transporter n=1 Tax=Pseudorhodoferax sp. Leaf265 TaxID=1736315 RepID=UPI0006F8FB90|nr:MFS transporter [Pseudorhodoferax sp. Leaf265]KQP18774.1 hypothetical protein ASF45_26500 [Pseudorhodoferax sp. Leaf265]
MSSDQAIGSGTRRVIELALALGCFAIATSEFALVGLMSNLAQELGFTFQQVGQLVSSYAVGVVVGAPAMVLLGAAWPRRKAMLVLLLLCIAGNGAFALCSGYWELMAARFVAGLPHGAFFGMASVVAASFAAPNERARAISRVMAGVTLAILIGTPFAAWFGEVAHWRAVYWSITALGVAACVALALVLPAQSGRAGPSARQEFRAFNIPAVWLALAVAAIGFIGTFAVFSFLAPVLQHVARGPSAAMPLLLALFGLGAFLGNLVGGWGYDRLNKTAIVLSLSFNLVALLAFPFLAQTVPLLGLGMFLVGATVALSPILQAHLIEAAPAAANLAASSNHAAFNIANALGPWLGGLAIGQGLGLVAPAYVGVAAAACALALCVQGIGFGQAGNRFRSRKVS